MLRNWKQILTMLLGAALFAGSLPLAAHADRDEKRHRERRVERQQERKHERKEVRQDRDRGHARHRDADREHRRDDDDDRDRRYSQRRDRNDCAPRVVHHHDRVVYARRPVHSGVTWGIYASNLPPDRCDYWDPYCGQRYASLHAYRSHLRHARHAHVIHVLDDHGATMCGYRDRGGDSDSWVQVTLAGNIRF